MMAEENKVIANGSFGWSDAEEGRRLDLQPFSERSDRLIMDDLQPLLTSETKIKVSSTLDKGVGKKCLTDGSPETCWTSQQGTPQHIQITFDSPVVPKQLAITFQGGFVGTRCSVDVQQISDSERRPIWTNWTTVFPEDVNRLQTFALKPQEVVEQGVQTLRLVFEESSDFFGRITVYNLQLQGILI